MRIVFREQFLQRRSVLTRKLKMSASTSPSGNASPSDRFPRGDHGVDQILLVLAIHDGEPLA